jgi:hypothetical protein
MKRHQTSEVAYQKRTQRGHNLGFKLLVVYRVEKGKLMISLKTITRCMADSLDGTNSFSDTEALDHYMVTPTEIYQG